MYQNIKKFQTRSGLNFAMDESLYYSIAENENTLDKVEVHIMAETYFPQIMRFVATLILLFCGEYDFLSILLINVCVEVLCNVVWITIPLFKIPALSMIFTMIGQTIFKFFLPTIAIIILSLTVFDNWLIIIFYLISCFIALILDSLIFGYRFSAKHNNYIAQYVIDKYKCNSASDISHIEMDTNEVFNQSEYIDFFAAERRDDNSENVTVNIYEEILALCETNYTEFVDKINESPVTDFYDVEFLSEQLPVLFYSLVKYNVPTIDISILGQKIAEYYDISIENLNTECEFYDALLQGNQFKPGYTCVSSCGYVTTPITRCTAAFCDIIVNPESKNYDMYDILDSVSSAPQIDVVDYVFYYIITLAPIFIKFSDSLKSIEKHKDME